MISRTVALLLLSICIAGPLAAQATSQPTTRPAVKSVAEGSPEALALARQVQGHAGGAEGWSRVRNLVFTFAGRQRVYWDVPAGRVRIENLEPPGAGRRLPLDVGVYDIAADEATLVASDTEVTDAAARLRAVWINHTYWLLVTLKVLDPGVTLSVDPRVADDPEGVERLRLAFADVGVTPDNQYVLHVESATGRVVRWDFHPTADARPMSWRFEGYRRVGPLLLSLSRPMIGGDRTIELEDVSIDVPEPPGIWTSERHVLQPAPDAPADGIEVEVRGTLAHGVMAIGGETTGTTITAGDITWELDLAGSAAMLEQAAALDGERALLKGRLERRPGVEIPERWVVVVTELRAAR